MMKMDRCHFWLAWFQDQKQIDEYFKESYAGDDDTPISLLAADQGETFYDHDWVSIESGEIDEILRGYNAPEDTKKIILDFAAKLDFKCNALIVADQDELESPVNVKKDAYQLAYVGCHVLHG